jgi:hypothetical protein
MIAGGLASKAGGGSFEDGAVQAGMVFLYNSRGAIKLNGKIPSWLNKLFDYEGQGGSVGIAFSAPGMLGDDEWDLGVFVEGHGGGDDYGIGKLTVGGENNCNPSAFKCFIIILSSFFIKRIFIQCKKRDKI